MPSAVAVIVDGVSQSAKLAKAFLANNIACIHVQTLSCAHDYYMKAICEQDYLKTIQYDGEFSHLLESLSGFSIRFVIAGFDTGVELADQLSGYFSLPANDPTSSALRRNKYLQNKHLPMKDFLQVNSDDELRHIKNYPVIVKPLQSASADSVYFCENRQAASNALAKVLATPSHLGENNISALIETALQGRELKVNTVSFEGKHRITDAWDMTKRVSAKGEILYDHAFLLMDDEVSDIQGFVFSILGRFGVEYGAATLDIMLCDDGPHLIELGARLMGSVAAEECVKKCISDTQIDTLVSVYCDTQNSVDVIERDYHLNQHLYVYYVHSPVAGVLKSISFLDEIKQLTSFYSLNCFVKLGDDISVTHDYSSIPLHITLQHEDREQIDQAVAQIKLFEREGIFQL